MRFPNIKIGDTVLRNDRIRLVDGGFSTGYSVNIVLRDTVTRLTKTQGVTESGIRFKLDNGNIIGDAFSVFPVGYVVKTYGHPDQVMEATDAKTIDDLKELAKSVRALQNAVYKFDQQKTRTLQKFVRGNVTIPLSAAIRLDAVTRAISELMGE